MLDDERIQGSSGLEQLHKWVEHYTFTQNIKALDL
jgi:hypothetical protein